jgi:hypothetical protein
MTSVTQQHDSGHAASALASKSVAAGVVEVENIGGGWWHIAIGRASRTKHFNLSRTEAAELVRLLREQVLTQDGSK